MSTAIVAILIAKTMPANPMMDFLSILFRAFYRVEIKGVENLLNAGHNPIIALNHTSFLDAALALSLLPKDPVFAIDSAMAQNWWVKPFLRFTRAMPLDPTKPMATRTLINAVKGGEPLIIFPEGRLTVTGSLMKVYDGAGLIADKTDAFVVPVRLEGLDATPFTRLSRAQVRRRWFPKVTVTLLEPVKLSVDPALKGKNRRIAAGAALYEIMSNLVYRTTSIERTVPEALIEAAEIHGMSRVAVEDPVTGTLSYRKLLLGARILGEKLMPLAPEGKPIGLMLPNANGAAVTLIALMSAGRVPAMINFTAGVANVLAACKASQVDTIVTSRAFIEKGRLDALIAGLEPTIKIVYLEDIRPTITLGDKLRGLRNSKKPLVERKPGDWAAILFTSGSEGTPKGVVLSHRNMLANAAQAAARIDFGRQDKVFNVLPVFHSFGLTVGLVLPLVSGVRIYLYPSPLHYRIVPELIYGMNATIMFGTDTFLDRLCPLRARLRFPLAALYPRRRRAGEGSDAAHVSGEVRAAHSRRLRRHRDRAGARAQHADVQQVRHRRPDAAGHGGAAGQGRGVEEGGRLFVKGPNVMLGYLRVENPGVLEPPPGGLARHRRHRHHRQAGLYRHQGPRQAVCQDRRRDDLVRRGRGAGERAVAGRALGGGRGARRAQGRAVGHGDAEEGSDAQRVPGVCPLPRRDRADGAGGDRLHGEAAAARHRQDRQHGGDQAGQGAVRRGARAAGRGGGVTPSAVIPGRAHKRVHARLRRAMGAIPESSYKLWMCVRIAGSALRAAPE